MPFHGLNTVPTRGEKELPSAQVSESKDVSPYLRHQKIHRVASTITPEMQAEIVAEIRAGRGWQQIASDWSCSGLVVSELAWRDLRRQWMARKWAA